MPFPCVQTIRFEGSQEEFQLVVEASSAPVAVFPAEALTDLRCCVFGKLYLKKVRLGMSWQTGSGSRLSLAFRGRIAWFYPALPCRTIGSPCNQLGKSFVSGLLRLDGTNIFSWSWNGLLATVMTSRAKAAACHAAAAVCANSCPEP